MNKPKQIGLEVATWMEAGVRKYKPMAILRPSGKAPYSELLFKHLITAEGPKCVVKDIPDEIDLFSWLPEVTCSNCYDIKRGTNRAALLVTEWDNDVPGWIEDLESTERLYYVLMLVLRITEVTMESILERGFEVPVRDDAALDLWKMMMEDREDRLYCYEEVRFIEEWSTKTNIAYIEALACRHLYTKSFALDDVRINEILRKYYKLPSTLRSANPVDMLFWFQYYPFHAIIWGGIEVCVSTLMKLYEMDGERVFRAVKSGPDMWARVFEACCSSFTCDEISKTIKSKSKEARSTIYDIIKAWGKLAMQETGLPEEVQCDLPYAKEFL